MFDWYEPTGVDACPICGSALKGWQGKHGPNALLVWRQGMREPAEQAADEEWQPTLEHLWIGKTLPPSFEIHTLDDEDHRVSAICAAPDGVWTETKLAEVTDCFDRDRRVLWRPDDDR